MTHAAQTLSGDDSLTLPEFDNPPADPVALLARWLDSAIERGVSEPRTFVLSTADERGWPSSRVVLLKEVTDRGLVFAGQRESRKGREMAAQPRAAANFHWRETLQQVCLTGLAEQLSDQVSDELFAERPVAAQAATAVSLEGQPLADEAELAARARRLVELREPIPRPGGWCGYLLVPDDIEFWHGRRDRLHRRLRYARTETGWIPRRLQP